MIISGECIATDGLNTKKRNKMIYFQSCVPLISVAKVLERTTAVTNKKYILKNTKKNKTRGLEILAVMFM